MCDTLVPISKFESLETLRVNWPYDIMLANHEEDDTLETLERLFHDKAFKELVLDVLPRCRVDRIECRWVNGAWYALSWPDWGDDDDIDDDDIDDDDIDDDDIDDDEDLYDFDEEDTDDTDGDEEDYDE
jgi:hypothetical protein